MSRFWANGITVTVEAGEDGAPLVFRWEQQRHTVQTIARRWRRDVGWWRARVWREYFIVRTTHGLLVELYHDVQQRTWAVQRVYD